MSCASSNRIWFASAVTRYCLKPSDCASTALPSRGARGHPPAEQPDDQPGQHQAGGQHDPGRDAQADPADLVGAGAAEAEEPARRHAEDDQPGADALPHPALLLRGVAEPAAVGDLGVHLRLGRPQGAGEVVLQVGEQHRVGGREQPVEDGLLVLRQRALPGWLQPGQLPVGAREHPAGGLLLDPQVAPHGEVDHRRADVDRARLLVHAPCRPGRGATPAGGVNCTATAGARPRTTVAGAPVTGVRPGVRPAYCSSRPRFQTRTPIRPAARTGRATPPPYPTRLTARAALGERVDATPESPE